MMRRVAAVIGWIFALGSVAAAQTVPPSALPGHQGDQFTPPIAPLSRPANPFKLPETMAPEAAAGLRLLVKSITVEGSTVYSAADFAPLYADLIGKEVSAADVYALANKIGAKYGKDGYLVARAIVVPQAVDPKGAALRIRVVEGFIEDIEWPAAAAHYRDLFTPCLAKIKAERPTRTKTIERCLLLANDAPGLTFSSSLKAGKNNNGGSVLVVTLAEKPFSAGVRVDNRGALGQGPWEQTTTLTENNRLGIDESTTLTYATAAELQELQYLSLNYHQLLTPDGLAFDSSLNHSIGKPDIAGLTELDYRERSTNYETGFTYPLIRQREQNLRLSALGFLEDAYSETLSAPFSDDRLRGIRLRANYDQVDTWLGTVAQSQIIGTFSQGIDGLGSTSNGNPLASVANGRVDFSKFEVFANRTQALPAGFSLYGAVDGVWSGSSLLAAEECTYGGATFGRAFDPDTLVGDRCLLELGELRLDLPIADNPFSQSQLYAFADHGDLFRVDPAKSTPGHSEGSSIGGGARFAWKDNFSVDIQAAKGFGDPINQGLRAFLILTARY
jgi:hemolysin activation/secretion protein